jgi:hypothetical protein
MPLCLYDHIYWRIGLYLACVTFYFKLMYFYLMDKVFIIQFSAAPYIG